jgi:hypothetical protein
MPVDLSVLCRRIDVRNTILFFGAGSSCPSGGPTGAQLTTALATQFQIETRVPLGLSDLATVIEAKFDRRQLIEALQKILQPLQPARGILNLPEYDWAALYTTNFDLIIERAYRKFGKHLTAIASNFDFGSGVPNTDQQLYKIHGTIDQDHSLGHQHRMVITAADYDQASNYRELLFAKLAEQLFSKSVIVIGHSLADSDLKFVVDEALRVKKSKGAPGSVTLLVFEKDDNLALVYEARGLQVCFGGIDDFFAELFKVSAPTQLLPGITDDPLDRDRSVHPSTISVLSSRASQTGNLARMFYGSPANYADIIRGWTFERDFADQLESQLASADERIAYVLGPAGCGKTTGVRKALSRLVDRDVPCWEHVRDLSFPAQAWGNIDDELRKCGQTGVLLIDDAHEHLHDINRLAERIGSQEKAALRLVLISSKPHWNPRLKSPSIFSHGKGYEIGPLSDREIDSLLDVLESSSDVSALVEQRFLGFNRTERRRRLAERCGADMFVCMKNIFGFEPFDEIILREYKSLNADYQAVYKRVAGMEAAGIRVHRQLVLRTVGIQGGQVARYLEDLDGIIQEKTINERHGIYGWSVRHSVIAEIIANYKLADPEEYYKLIENTVDNLNPTYEIEIRSMNEICSMKKGLGKIYNRNKQNVLLRKMISLAPRERVPRHRLITNLIDQGEYEAAHSEIRLFENELRLDGPVQRYKVKLLIERARHASGLMDEDRAAMVREAATLAEAGIQTFKEDKNLHAVYLEAGLVSLRYQKSYDIFDRAMQAAQAAYDRILDPDLARTISRYQRIEQRTIAGAKVAGVASPTDSRENAL